MRPGKVVNIRISPANCMAIYDALKLAGVNPASINFNSAASRVFDMMMEGLRRDKVIPIREGFEFTPIMEEFSQSSKIALPGYTKTPDVIDTIMASKPNIPATTTAEQRLARLRFKELMIKKENAPDSWSDEDEAELDQVYKQMG